MLRLVAGLALLFLGACSPKFDWREIRSAQDGYVVSLPGKPQVVTRDVELPLSGAAHKVSMTMTSAGVGPTMFAVGVAHLPPGATAEAAVLEACVAYFRDGLLRNIGAKAAASEGEPVLLGLGAPSALRAARSFQATGAIGGGDGQGQPARLAARIYVVDDRVYQIVAMGRAEDLPDNEIETFFTSFRLSQP